MTDQVHLRRNQAPHANRHAIARFFSRVGVDGDCWEWRGAINSKGYGVFDSTSAHRWAHELGVGSIPTGYDVHHVCGNRRCVNPAHLLAVSRQEHHVITKREVFDAQTHCRHGHLWALYLAHQGDGRGGRERYCRACHRERSRRYMARQRERMVQLGREAA